MAYLWDGIKYPSDDETNAEDDEDFDDKSDDETDDETDDEMPTLLKIEPINNKDASCNIVMHIKKFLKEMPRVWWSEPPPHGHKTMAHYVLSKYADLFINIIGMLVKLQIKPFSKEEDYKKQFDKKIQPLVMPIIKYNNKLMDNISQYPNTEALMAFRILSIIKSEITQTILEEMKKQLKILPN